MSHIADPPLQFPLPDPSESLLRETSPPPSPIFGRGTMSAGKNEWKINTPKECRFEDGSAIPSLEVGFMHHERRRMYLVQVG
jgi:hypothetical protein